MGSDFRRTYSMYAPAGSDALLESVKKFEAWLKDEYPTEYKDGSMEVVVQAEAHGLMAVDLHLHPGHISNNGHAELDEMADVVIAHSPWPVAVFMGYEEGDTVMVGPDSMSGAAKRLAWEGLRLQNEKGVDAAAGVRELAQEAIAHLEAALLQQALS